MAKITRKYPFSDYVVEKASLSGQQQDAADALLAAARSEKTVAAFCARFPKAKQDDLKKFLNYAHALPGRKPLAGRERNEFLEKASSAIAFAPEPDKIALWVLEELQGYIVMQPLLDDDDLEEIMINNSREVFVFHRKYGLCKADVEFENAAELAELAKQIGLEDGQGYADFRLSDGSRANVIAPPAVSEHVITVQKFRQNPFSVVELIEKGTLSAELAAYLWTAIDGLGFHPLNVMIAGGTAAGKTTTLNALSSFIPPSDRIVTIEDAPELNFFERDNWVQMITTDKMDLPGLLRNCLRMRPDRIIVGDIRGEEASTLFTAMNTGHRGSMGTFHANSDRDAMKRLENEPMSVPRALIPLADIIMVQHRVRGSEEGSLARRVMQVSEISQIEDVIALNPLFAWNPDEDVIEHTKFGSEAVEKIATFARLTKNQVSGEIEKRAAILESLSEEKIVKQSEVDGFMRAYYSKSLFGTEEKSKTPA
ncbi:MAG: ATPase, T2SS/T4P/T4SS family [Candidatus Micrarchaeota archaeon]